MAVIKPTGKTYFDPYTNTDCGTAYGVVRTLDLDHQNKIGNYVVDVWCADTVRQAAKTDGRLKPLGRIDVQIHNDEFDTYFSPAVISGNGDHVEMAYVHFLSAEKRDPLTDQTTGVLLYGNDWESDE